MFNRRILPVVILIVIMAMPTATGREHSVRGKIMFERGNWHVASGKPFEWRYREPKKRTVTRASGYAAVIASRKKRRAKRGVFDFRR